MKTKTKSRVPVTSESARRRIAFPFRVPPSALGQALLCFLGCALFASPSFAQLTGPKSVPGDYATVAAAITDLNAQGVGAGGVTFNVAAGYTETAPTGGFSITATGTAPNPIVFQKSGAGVNPIFTAPTPQTSGGALNDAIFKIIGGDFITIDGFTMLENAANTITTAGTNNMTEWGIALLYASATNGCQNVTIQNNTIDLDRTYQNTFGIYANSTHTATAISSSATATGATGGNHNLKIYGNTITDVNNGIVVLGPTAAADNNDGLDIGGTSAPSGNSITNFGTTGTFSSYANVSGTVNGILVRNTKNFNLSRNTVNSSNGGVTVAGTINGIQIPASSNTPTGTLTQTINNNSISVRGGNVANILNGINMPSGSVNATTACSMNGNDFNTFGHTVAGGTGAISFIIQSGNPLVQNFNTNTFTNMSVNTTGTITFFTYAPAQISGSSLSLSGNQIVTGFTRTGVGATTVWFSFASSVNGSTHAVNNNNFSNITLTGASAFTGISDQDGASASSGPVKSVDGNTFSNVTTGAGTVTPIFVNFSGPGSTVNGNTITGITTGNSITALLLGSSNQATITVSGNIIDPITSGGSVIGISTASPTTVIAKNKIYDLIGTAAGSVVQGIQVLNAAASNTVTLSNNLIGNLTAPIATSANGIIGINTNVSSATSTFNVFYNTVYLNNTTSGVGFGSSGLSTFASSTATTSTLNLRNNIVVNTSIQNGAGLTVAYRRSAGGAGTLANYASTSNNNDFFAATPSATSLIYSDGTANVQTMAAYKAGVFTAGTIAPRDSASFSENPPFLSTIGSDATFLHINPATPTQIESGGGSGTGVTDDFDGDMRNVTTPDVGADEFSGIAIDLNAPNISYTPLSNTGSTGNRTLLATITDATGVPISGAGLPVLYWKIGAGSYSAATATSLGGNQYQFTFGSGVSASDVVSYYVVAQDAVTPTPNVGAFPATGAAGFTASPPAAGTPPTSPSSYTVVAAYTGSYDVGTGQTYTSLSGAGGLFAAINGGVVTGNVTVNLTSDLTETGAISLNQWTEEGAGSYTVTVQASGAARLISGSNTTALINLNGADRVTFDGSAVNRTAATAAPAAGGSLTIRNTSATTGSVFRYINDASNNAIISCTLEQNNTSSSAVLYSTGVTTGNDNNSISGCIIRGTSSTVMPFNSIVSQGTSTAISNSNLSFTNNQLTDFGQVGILTFAGTDNITIAGNDISQTANRTTALTGININGTLLGTNLIANNAIHGLRSSFAGGSNPSVEGIFLGDARATTVSGNQIYGFPAVAAGTGRIVGIEFGGSSSNPANATLVNNMVSIVTSVATTNTIFGIFDFSWPGNTITIDANTVYIGGTATGATTSWGIVRGTGAPTTFTMRNNVAFNDRVSTGNRFAGGDQSANTGTFVSNGNLFAGTGTTAANFMDYGTAGGGTAVSFAAWKAGPPARDANSIGNAAATYNPATFFVNAVAGDLHLASNTTPAANAGIVNAAVTTDFDGHARSAIKPDIGADEIASNSLSALLLSMGVVIPDFDPLVLDYTVGVSNSVADITVTPTVLDSNATVTVNGDAVASGSPSNSIPLNVGANVISVVVTPEFGPFRQTNGPDAVAATKTYTITATRAAPTYMVTYDGNGSTGGSDPIDANAYLENATVTVLGHGSLVRTGYTFSHWNTAADDSGTSYNAGATFSMPANNVLLNAIWSINTYTLTYTANAGGSISGTSPQTVNHGASGTAVTGVPDSGYHFVNWSDASTDNPRTDTNVTANITVTATFAINTYVLTYTAGAGGSIVGTNPQTVNHGDDGTLVTATPDANYHFVSWSDGYPTAARTDLNVTANISATANFAIDPADYTVTTTGNAIVVTDASGNSDTLAVSQPSAGNIMFAAAGRTFSVDGGAPISGNSGSLSRAGVTSITVNEGDGDDIANVGAFTGTMPSLTMNGGAGNDTINFNGSITFAANANLDVDLQNDTLTPGTDDVMLPFSTILSTSGTGTITVKLSKTLVMNSGSKLLSVNGNILVETNQQATPTTGEFAGVVLSGAVIEATGTGVVTVSARGGTTGFGPYGISMSSGAMIKGGTTPGMITTDILGTGGTGTDNPHGVFPQSTTSITSAGGDVRVRGFAGPGTGANNYGVVPFGTAVITSGGNGNVVVEGTGGSNGGGGNVGVIPHTGGTITSGGTGTVTITGTGGAGPNSHGIQLFRDGRINSGGAGAVVVTGSTSSSSSTAYGIFLNSADNTVVGARINSGGGPITVTGSTGGTFGIFIGGGVGVQPLSINTIASTGNGAVTLIADTMKLDDTGINTINSGSGLTTIRQLTNGKNIDLGGNDSGAQLGLTDNELDKVTSGTMQIGNANSGAVNVTAAITQTGKITNIAALTTTTLHNTASMGIAGTVSGPLTVNPGAELRPGTSPGVINSGNLSWTGGAVFEIGGLTPGNNANNHDQVNVTGTVLLNNPSLTVMAVGGFVPVPGQSFTILTNDSTDTITGTFNSLPEGATISNFLGSGFLAKITYVGGTDNNDVVITVLSQNANLSNLVLSAGAISPAFDANTTSYTLSVPNSTSSTTVTPTAADANATIKVNGVTVASGTPSGSIALNVGGNTITTVVTAQDGTTTKTYTVMVTRAVANYTLTYTAGLNGSISGASPQTVPAGGSGTAVTAVPNAGYHFVNWSDASIQNPRTDTNVMGDISVTANFAINSYTLTYTANANGTISGSSPQTVNHGASGTAVTAVPNAGYHFVNWSDSSTQNPRTDTNVMGDITVSANFAINTYTLTYTAGSNGTISGTSPQTVNHGASGSAVTAVPNFGYVFLNWSDSSTSNPRTDTNVMADISVTANFATVAPATTVYVDDDWAGTTLGDDPDGGGPATSFGYDAFATIQDGVNGVAARPAGAGINLPAAPGPIVFVAAGTYPEAVTVSSPMTINGPQAGQNANTRFAAFTTGGPDGPKANPAVEAIVTAAANAPASGANDTFHIMSDDVIVDGFVFDGNNPSLNQAGAAVVGGVNTNSRRALQTENAAGVAFAVNNLTVRYNVFQNFSQRGVELINGTASNTAPATTGNVITQNLVRNFGLDGIVLAFNAYADITFNTVVTNDYPTEAGIWVQDFLNTGTPHTNNITNNDVTVGQDNFGGIWVNLVYQAALNINDNTINAAATVSAGDDFTYGIYVSSLRPGSTVSLDGNVVGASGGEFDRGIALWNIGSVTTTTTVTGGTVGNSVKGVSLVDNDANFGLAGSNAAALVTGVTVDGGTIGLQVDATGSTGDTVAMEITGDTAVSNSATAISVTGANASANIHDNAASIHNNTTGIEVSAATATITSNNLYANGTGLKFASGASATAHFNRILSSTTAIANPNNLTLNLENNWWGCNAGPGNAGCGAVTGTGADFNPWMVLKASATPNSIAPGGTSAVATDMTMNSDNATPVGTLPDMLASYSATNGTMLPTSATVVAGMAGSTFTSTNSISAVVSTTVDNETVNTPIAVNAPSFSISDVTQAELNGGQTSFFTFTVTKTGSTAFTTAVDVHTQDGSAAEPSDYYPVPLTTLTFGPNDTTMQVSVVVWGDTLFEVNETFTVELTNAVDATISDASGLGTITNDDTAPTISIDSVTIDEAAGTADFTVTQSAVSGLETTFTHSTANGSAVAPGDYTAATNVPDSIPAGMTTATISIPINDDNLYEHNEDFTVTLGNENNATITTGTGTGTITDNDNEPTFSINNVTQVEGDGPGTTNFVFTVTKNGASGQGSSVHYETMDGTATTANNDYLPTSGDLVFGPNDTSMPVTVQVQGDTTYEPDETFTVVLSNAVNDRGEHVDVAPQGVGTIVNDDVRPPAPIVYVDDDWALVPNGTDPDMGGPATEMGYDAFATVQGGVSGVASGGLVNVAAGTYVEQVSVNKNATLTGAGAASTIIQAPAVMANDPDGAKTIVLFTGLITNEFSGFTVQGPVTGINFGIYVRAGANVNIHDNTVKDIRDNPLSGAQSGYGIEIGKYNNTFPFVNQVGTATITNNIVIGYQKTGIECEGAGSSATITGNTVTGAGLISTNAQNGIQIRRGATGSINGNTVTGNAYTGHENNASGITVTYPGNDVIVQNNIVNHNTANIYTYEANGIQILNNQVTDATDGRVMAGITADSDNVATVSVGITVTITGNNIQNNLSGGTQQGNGIFLWGVKSGTISGNTIVGNGDDGLLIGASGNITITGNTITGNGFNPFTADANAAGIDFGGLIPELEGFGMQPNTLGGFSVHHNRIVGNVKGLWSYDTASTNAENNWWGCNAGPGGTGCDAVGGVVDFNPWMVLNASATPNSIAPGGTSAVATDMTMNSDNATPVGTLPDTLASYSATNGTMLPTSAPVVAGMAGSTFTSSNSSSAVVSTTVDNETVYTPILVNVAGVVTVTPAVTPTVSDNDYTRINNAVQLISAGQTIKLLGTFDWTEAFAAASWALGSDGIADTEDDYSVYPPAGLNNVTFTADNLGDATIQGPGDLAAFNLEAVFYFDGGPNQGWTISNIRFVDFDNAIGFFSGAGGASAFNGTQIVNNYIRVARDLNATVAPGDVSQNIGLHYSFGMNQLISGNTIEIQGDGVSDGANFATDVGMQSNTGGGNAYDGLQITNNIIRVLNAQSANPEVVLGIWENGHAHGSNITVSGNSFTNLAGGNNPATNLQRAFRVTSHSSGSTTVTYANNLVEGANIGFQWLAPPANFAGNQPVRLTSNTIVGNGTGVLVQSQGLANLSFNRIVGNTAGLNNVDGLATAENNWWGCNAGPGNAGCDAVGGVVDFNPWMVLNASATPNSIAPGGTSAVATDMTMNSDNATPVGTLPDTLASYSATNGTMLPTSAPVVAGMAGSTFTSTNNSSAVVSTTVDNQTVNTPITVTAPSFSIDDVTMNEGAAGTTNFVFTVTKTGASAFNTSVDVQTQDGSATEPSDYTAVPLTTLNFGPSDTSMQVTVPVKGDMVYEPTETFLVNLSNAVSASISDASGTGTITNDDDEPIFTVDDVALPEGNMGTTPFVFTVTKVGASGQSSIVNYATVGGTATTADGDYQATSGTLTFGPNDTTMQVTVLVNGDAKAEPDETFSLVLTSVVNNRGENVDGALPVGVGTIQNDDAGPTFAIDNVTQAEGNAGPANFVFTVTKTGATAFTTSVNYATANGTATAPSDYAAITSTVLTFLPNETSKQITVTVNGDLTPEPNETFTINLSNPVNASISGATGTGTITNDDGPPAIVYVDDDWALVPNGTDPDAGGPATEMGFDAFATIQDGVNGVANPGTVIVRAGTYPEAVTVNKALNMMGAQAGQSANTRFAAFIAGPNGPKADPAVESILTAAATAPASAANDTLHIMSNNVTFDGFVVDGNNPSLAQGGATVIGGINTDVRRGIQTENAAGVAFAASNVTVRYNIMQNFAQRGVEFLNGTASNTAPATAGNVITQNLVRNFGLDGIVMAFNAYADITFNTVVTNDYPTEAGIWVQDFLNTGTPHTMNITNNDVTVGQDNFGGIWVNLAYLDTLNINGNTVNAASGVVGAGDFTYGIYLTSLRPGTTASLTGNIVGATGGELSRGIALWNLGTASVSVNDSSIGKAIDGITLQYVDPNFGAAGASSTAQISRTTVAGTQVGVLVDGTSSGANLVTMRITNSTLSGNTAATGGALSSVGTSGSASTTITNSTLTGNSPSGAAITLQDASLTVGNTIFHTAGAGSNISALGTSLVTSLGYNLSSDTFGGFLSGTGDQTNVDAILGPLQNNGGPTLTHAPLSNSPALDRGKDLGPVGPAFAATGVDQRGNARPVTYLASIIPPVGGDRSDIGAVELAPGVQPLSTVSRKTHGAAGDFDVNLPLSGPVAIECRSGGAMGDFQIVVTFASPVTFDSAVVTSGVGTINSASIMAAEGVGGGTTITINLTGVGNAQRLTVGILGVSDGVNTGDVGIRVGMVLGDTTGDGAVDAADVSQTKVLSGQSTDLSNFRNDTTADGAINAVDIGQIKAQSGINLPPTPTEPIREDQ